MSEHMRTLLLAAALLVAIGINFLASGYYLSIVLCSLLLGLFASAADLSIGRAGVLSLGSALYFGIGSYSLAWAQRFGAGFGLGLALGTTVAAALALAIGFLGLTSRRTTVQFALFTLVASLTCEQLIVNSDVLGRSNGLPDIQLPTLGGQRLTVSTYYAICTPLIFAAVAALRAVSQSRWGRLLVLIRDEPEKAESLGYSVKRTKILVTVVSAAVSAACGVAYVPAIGIAYPDLFSIVPNMLLLVWIALGGPGTVLGPFIATTLIKLMEFWLGSTYTNTYVLIIGVIFVLVVRYRPGGLSTLVSQQLTAK